MACFTKIKSPPSPHRTNLDRPFSDASHPSVFINNFNSLYDNTNSNFNRRPDSDSDSDYGADFATAFASRRFFFSSPGRSNSIIDSSSSSYSSTSLASASTSTSSSNSLNRRENAAVSNASVAVPTFSPDPYHDFRRSMQEMVEARGIRGVREDWEYLHRLLACYLSLNPKSTHKFIVGAFADLLVTLMSSHRRKPPIRDGKRKASLRIQLN